MTKLVKELIVRIAFYVQVFHTFVKQSSQSGDIILAFRA